MLNIQFEYSLISFIVMLTFVLLTVTFYMYYKWKKKMYLFLTGSFAITFITHVIIFVLSYMNDSFSIYSMLYTASCLISFALLQVGLYHLFQPKETKKIWIYLYFSAGILLLSIFILFISATFSKLFILLGIIGLIVYFLYWPALRLKNNRLYQTHLVLYGVSSVLAVCSIFVYIPIIVFISMITLLISFLITFLLIQIKIFNMILAASYNSLTDALTGLYNRDYFNKRIHQYFNNKKEVSVIFCDIDNFKQVNDIQGHDKGDEILKFVANIIREETNGIGIGVRYGGEEMVALITDPTIDTQEIAEAIRRRVQKESSVTLSIGYSRYTDGVTPERLTKEADIAMYKAKRSGKNKVAKYSPEDEVEKEPSDIHKTPPVIEKGAQVQLKRITNDDLN